MILSLSYVGWSGITGFLQPRFLPTSKNEDTNDEDEDEVERIVDGDLSAVKAGTFEPCKLACHTCVLQGSDQSEPPGMT
ncbi:hypothetical protein C0989_011097 [Termitomyces sp. Mn162]|nr:hypothetical protein C0989_011097 [Termitomyces sp. Mn162]